MNRFLKYFENAKVLIDYPCCYNLWWWWWWRWWWRRWWWRWCKF